MIVITKCVKIKGEPKEGSRAFSPEGWVTVDFTTEAGFWAWIETLGDTVEKIAEYSEMFPENNP